MLSVGQVRRTGEWIASVQLSTGAIPWFEGGHLDVWDHVQSAMGLATVGLADEAVAAFGWLERAQRPDGSWAIKYWPGLDDDGVEDPGTDANFCAYVAVGLWHGTMLGLDLRRFWPMLHKAIDCVLSMRLDHGVVAWARGADGTLVEEALLTGSSSLAMSLRCAARLAERWGTPRPEWAATGEQIGRLVVDQPELFAPRSQFSMDWYYPVLCGLLADPAHHLDASWDDFVVPGLGVRCVSTNPWVTGAESCELVLALVAAGRHEAAARIFDDVQHLRDPDGSYWTGLVYADGKRWPVEQSTWTAATVVLAHDALTRTTPAHALFGP